MSSQAPRPRFWFAPLAARQPDPAPTPNPPRTPFIRPMFAQPVSTSPPSPPPQPPQPPPQAPPLLVTLPAAPAPATPAAPAPAPAAPAPAPAAPATPAPPAPPAPSQPVAPRTPFLRPLFAQTTVPSTGIQPAPPVVEPSQMAPQPQAPPPRTPFLGPRFNQPTPASPVPQPLKVSPVIPPPPPSPLTILPTSTKPTSPPPPTLTIIPTSTKPAPSPTSPPLPTASPVRKIRSPASPPAKPISPPPPSSSSLSSPPLKPTLTRTISPVPTIITRSPSSPPPPLTLPPAAHYKPAIPPFQDRIIPEAEQKNITVKEINPHTKLSPPAKPSMIKTIFKNGKPTEKVHTQKKTSPESDQEQGIRMITIAGDNKGAIMELSSPLRKSGPTSSINRELNPNTKGMNPPVRTFTNSNVQGVNNSIIYNSSCTHNDPGVHLSLVRKPSGIETSKVHKSSPNA